MSLLELDDVSVTYRVAEGEVPAVRGVSLTLDSGAALGVAGESGSGKSTLAFLGVSANKTSWGTMLRGSYDWNAASAGAWWYILIPGLCILAVVMAFNPPCRGG